MGDVTPVALALPAAEVESAGQRARRHLTSRSVGGVLVVIAVLVVWQAASTYGLVHPVYIPKVTKILRALWEILVSGELLVHYGHSFKRIAVGYTLACILGVSLGTIIGYSRVAFNLTEPSTEMLRPIPSPAIIPMLILLLGIGDAMKFFIITWACFWPILVNTIDGVRSVDRTLVDTAHTFGSSNKELLRKIILPAASPQIVTGMRISVALALILTVISEMVAGSSGIGFFILDSERSFRVPEMYAGTFSLAGVGYVLNRGFVAASDHFMAWHKGLTSKEAR